MYINSIPKISSTNLPPSKSSAARGQTVRLPGKVVFVSPLVQAGDRYRVRAEVENRQQNEHWLLRPGMSASMTIHVQMAQLGVASQTAQPGTRR